MEVVMIHQMSRRITRSLINNDIIRFDDVSVYQYGLEVLLMTAVKLLGIIFIGVMTGYLIESILFVLAFSSIRVYAGGYHAPSIFKCFALTLCFIFADILICSFFSTQHLPILSVLSAFVGFGLIYKYSPVAVVNRPVTLEEKKKFRDIAIKLSFTYLILIIGIVITNTYIWYVSIFSVGMLIEALTLIIEKYREEKKI